MPLYQYAQPDIARKLGIVGKLAKSARAVFVAVLASASLAACSGISLQSDFVPPEPGPKRAVYVPQTFDDLPGWKAENLEEVVPAILASCSAVSRRDPLTRLGPSDVHGRMSDLQAACRDLAAIDPRDAVQLRFFFESRFQPYLVRYQTSDIGKVTGYYEAIVNASWQADDRFRYPVYRRPTDIIVVDLADFDPEMDGKVLAARQSGPNKVIPYFTREEINAGALRGRELELLWVDSPIDLFFMHVQGSGRALMPDGTYVRLAFSGRNGHRYTSIGRELIAEGVLKLEQVSLQSIRAWLRANPLAAPGILNRNKSYIFFRVEKDDAVKGAQGIALTPGRSVAVDRSFTQLGSLLWLDTTDPINPKNTTPLRRLMVAQDVGSAIKGPQRIDVFWGGGELAEARAGMMNEEGRVFVLFPKK